MLAAGVVLLIIGAALFSWWSAPRIEIRNDSGRVLTNVRVEAFQLDTGKRLAEADALEPGESIWVSGGDLDNDLELRSVTFDGPAGVTRPAIEGGVYARPFNRAVYAVGADGRLRTIVGPQEGPCLCPGGNAVGTGSFDCPIFFHREQATKAALAPRSTR